MDYAALLLYGPRDLRWTEGELKPPEPGEVWLETLAGAVSVGTELPLYRGDARAVAAPAYPLMTGYESLARVVRIGREVENVRASERVVATYGHRTAACVSASKLMRVPEGVPDEIALLAILSNDAGKGIGKMRLGQDDVVLITGAGTIGLLALYRLRWLEFSHVDVVEPEPERRKLALTLGARKVFSPGELNDEHVYAAGVECSSHQNAFATLQRHLKIGGQICILADGNLEPLVLTPEFHARELSVVGSSDGEDYPGYARAFFSDWQGTKAPLDKLFTLRIEAGELPETFERLEVEKPVKVFVSYK